MRTRRVDFSHCAFHLERHALYRVEAVYLDNPLGRNVEVTATFVAPFKDLEVPIPGDVLDIEDSSYSKHPARYKVSKIEEVSPDSLDDVTRYGIQYSAKPI